LPEVLTELVHLPLGSHCISFHATREEAADHAVEFLAGAPQGQASSYWVGDPSLETYYRDRLAERAPNQVGCVHVLDHEQVHEVDGRLRPVGEVTSFVGAHPEGVTGGAETITRYWTPENVPDHLEYEAWFDAQARDASRFLCPYDLRRIPPEDASRTMRELGAHHSHVVLSLSEEPAVRLLQLFVFGTAETLPPELGDSFRWAMREGLVRVPGPGSEMTLTDAGVNVIRKWSETTSIDW